MIEREDSVESHAACPTATPYAPYPMPTCPERAAAWTHHGDSPNLSRFGGVCLRGRKEEVIVRVPQGHG
jgi:hypothetical protein